MLPPVSPQECQQQLEECHRICLQALVHGLGLHTRPLHESHLRLLLDCAELCQTCAGFLLRGSDLAGVVACACASVCERCAEFCGERRDDALLRRCELVCLRCSESCARMAA